MKTFKRGYETYADALCECGTRREVYFRNIQTGMSKSCGCLRSDWTTEHRTTHGHTVGARTKTYMVWCAMKERCSNPHTRNYARYGGRGIKVDERWMEFANFLEDMGVKPDRLSLDRIDVNGNYCKENCKWATRREQANNMRSNRWLTLNGESHTLAQWARQLEISDATIRNRIKKGLPMEKVLCV